VPFEQIYDGLIARILLSVVDAAWSKLVHGDDAHRRAVHNLCDPSGNRQWNSQGLHAAVVAVMSAKWTGGSVSPLVARISTGRMTACGGNVGDDACTCAGSVAACMIDCRDEQGRGDEQRVKKTRQNKNLELRF
jgi:hypothetical protein